MSAASVIPEEDRRTYLGSHDTAGIIGCSPYLNPMQVYLNKISEGPGREPTEPQYFGKLLEPVILREFAKRYKVELEPERFIRHPKLEWFGGTPDATIVGRKAGVDAKNVRYAHPAEWGEPGTDEVPEHLAFQAHHFMTLLDYDVWYIAALCSGNEFRIYTVERDRELSDMILELDETFWKEHVAARVPPPIDGSESCTRMLQKMNPVEKSGIREAAAEEITILDELKSCEASKEQAEDRINELRNQLRFSLGDAAGIKCETARVSYKQAKGRETIDVEALRNNMPEIARQFTRIAEPTRTLRVTFTKERI